MEIRIRGGDEHHACMDCKVMWEPFAAEDQNRDPNPSRKNTTRLLGRPESAQLRTACAVIAYAGSGPRPRLLSCGFAYAAWRTGAD